MAPISHLSSQWLKQAGVSLSVLRLDKIDPVISGNKWYKLRFHLQAAQAENASVLISFGGAHSNHLHALASAAQASGLKTLALVRGEQPKELSITLQDCQSMGMQLQFISREEYRLRNRAEFLQALLSKYKGAYIIPEGGAGFQGLQGAASILDGVDTRAYSCIATACGTGTTLAGLTLEQPTAGPRFLGISALKDQGSIADKVSVLLQGQQAASWSIDARFHGGGFAKINAQLVAFMDGFYRDYGFSLDPIYTSKLFFALQTMIVNGEFSRGEHILALHTGGLQGLRGMQQRMQSLRDHTLRTQKKLLKKAVQNGNKNA